MRRGLGTALVLAGLLTAAACGGQGDAHPARTPAGSTAPATPATGPAGQPIRRYVALGDSYTSGAGIPTVDYSNGCQRSDHNYPTLLAARIGADLVDVSCGGATTADVTGVQPNVTPAPQPMIDAVTKDTDLVTVSLGLNDQFLIDPVILCPELAAQSPPGTPCTDWEKAEGGLDLWSRIPGIEQQLVAVLQLAAQRAPNARVLLVGVPQLVPAHGSCAAYPIDAGDYPYYREAFVRLAEAMRQAAQATGATYVDVLGPSAGHDLCAGQDAWVNGSKATGEAIAYHPFAVEQAVIADLVEKALRQQN